MGVILQPYELKKAARLLQADELVVFPTETVYGLGGNALSSSACQGIFLAKNRPQSNPLIVHVPTLTAAFPLVQEFPDWAKLLCQFFWPGPLTLLLPRNPFREDLRACLGRAKTQYIALRCPRSPLAQQLLHLLPFPVAAPSANFSGTPSATSYEMALPLLPKVAAILKGPPAEEGIESTIVMESEGNVWILRPGSVPQEHLEICLATHGFPQKVFSFSQQETASVPPTPGTKHPHYRPETPLFLWSTGAQLKLYPFQASYSLILVSGEMVDSLEAEQASWLWRHRVTAPSNTTTPEVLIFWDLKHYAQHLYQSFFLADKTHKSAIFAFFPSQGLLGPSVRDRLEKASRNTIVP